MTSLCIPGLQGFPIQLSDWNINNQKVLANDISLQFSPNKIPITPMDPNGFFNINGQNTFFIGGSQYIVKALRICNPMQTGLNSVKPYAELHFWGYPINSNEQNSIGLLNIPIFIVSNASTSAGDKLKEALKSSPVNIQDLIPSSENINVIRYSTCVETDKNYTVNIKVAYWEKGLSYLQEFSNFLPKNLGIIGIPSGNSPYTFLNSYVQNGNGKINRIYKPKTNGLNFPYSTSLSASNTDVKNVFGYIKGFTIQSSSSEFNTDMYKCITIDKSRDIKDGKLLIDPSTGKRLSDDINETNENNASLNVKVQSDGFSPKWIIIYLLSVIFAVGFIILIGYYLFKLYNYSVSTPEASVAPVAPKVNAGGTNTVASSP